MAKSRSKIELKLVTIGLDEKTSRPVTIDSFGRARSTYIVGKTGMGKTTVLEQIVYQDMLNGDGLLFLDPHGDSAQKLLERVPHRRIEDVIFWDPSNIECAFGLNPFWCPDPLNPLVVGQRADGFVAALASLKEFAEIFVTAPRMKNMLHNLAVAFVVNQGHTLVETPRFLTDESFRKSFYPKLSHPLQRGVLEFWQRFDEWKKAQQAERIESSINKLERFESSPILYAIFSQPENSIDFRQAMDSGKVILVKLNQEEMGPDTAGFVGAFIVWEVMRAMFSRSNLKESARRSFHVIADEFQTYMTTAFPALQAQARKYGVDSTVAHQVREQLEGDLKELTRAVGNLIVFQVTAPNAEALVGEFKVEVPEPPIQRYEPKYEIVHNVLEHLGSHGHEDNHVMILYTNVMSSLNVLYEDADELEKSLSSGGRRAEQPPTSLSYRQEAFKSGINAFLYEAMRSTRDASSEMNKLDWLSKKRLGVRVEVELMLKRLFDNLHRGILDPMVQHKFDSYCSLQIKYLEGLAIHNVARDQIYIAYAKMVGIEDLKDPIKARDAFWELCYRTRPDLIESRSAELEEVNKTYPIPDTAETCLHRQFNDYLTNPYWEKARHLGEWVFVLGMWIADLAWDLRNKPCYAPSGQLEPRLEPRRLVTDVAAQMANELTTLISYHARVKLTRAEGIIETTIITQPLTALPDYKAAEKIKRQSCEKYGNSPAAFSVPPSSNGGTNDDDIDPDEFGEKKTRH